MFIEILGLRAFWFFNLWACINMSLLILWIFKSPYYVSWGQNFKVPWYWHL